MVRAREQHGHLCEISIFYAKYYVSKSQKGERMTQEYGTQKVEALVTHESVTNAPSRCLILNLIFMKQPLIFQKIKFLTTNYFYQKCGGEIIESSCVDY